MSAAKIKLQRMNMPTGKRQPPTAGTWKVQASAGALNTSNPIREIIESMNLAENPNKKVIPLSIGDPTIFGNLKPCKEILDALQKANSCGKYYGYQTAAGLETAREAVAEYHFRCTGNKVKRQDVILASGCSHAIDLCICVLARPGQNILIPRPGFPLYKTLTSVYGVHFKQYDLLADKNWTVDLKHLESLIDENTAAIVINNPSNPCGSVFSKRHLLQILELAERYRKPIIADEIYDKFVFSPELYSGSRQRASLKGEVRRSSDEENQHRSPGDGQEKSTRCSHNSDAIRGINEENLKLIEANGNKDESEHQEGEEEGENEHNDEDEGEFEDEHEHEGGGEGEGENDNQIEETGLRYVPFRSLSSLSKTVPILTCGGISKTCLIPGLRLGWIIINDKQNIFDNSVRNGLNRLTQRLMGPNSLVQGALHDILTNVPESFYEQTMDFIFRNAKICYDRLKLVKGLQPHMPQGSMYLMVGFDAKLFPDIDGDLDFTSKLMNEESVLVLPGKCFDFPDYFRICLTVPTNVMEEALVRIEEFCERHRLELEDVNEKSSKIKTINADCKPIKLAIKQATSNNCVEQSQTNGLQTILKLNLSSTNNINGRQLNKCK